MRKKSRNFRFMVRRFEAFDTSKAGTGKRLILLRRAYGLSQKEMAEAIGITAGALNKIEKGKNRLATLNGLVVWLKFGAPLEWIYAGFAQTLSDDLRRRLAQGPPPSQSS